MNPAYIRNIIEAALLAAGQPLPVAELARLFDEAARPSTQQLQAALEALAEEYAGRGIELKHTAGGYRIQVRRELAAEISRLWPERTVRYSRALLETLALIAYRQPITRAEIEQIRGVGVATSIVKTLEEREWVRVVGYRDLPGKPALLGTTRAFLDYFNLKSLDQLPPLSDIRELEDVDPQLALATDGKIPATLADEPDLAFADTGEMPTNEDSSPDDSVAAHAGMRVHDDTPEPAA